MQTFSTLYTNLQNLEIFIDDNNISRDQTALVRVVTSSMTRSNALKLARKIKNMLPNCDVIGMTSSFSVVFESEIVDDTTLIIIDCYDNLSLNCQFIKYEGKNYKDVTYELHQKFKKEVQLGSTVNILITPAFVEINELVLELNKQPIMMKIAGAVVGIMPHNEDTGFVFTDTEILSDVILAFSLNASNSHHYIGATFSYEPDEKNESFTITEIEHNIIKKVDDRNAADWLYEYLDISDKSIQFSPNFLARFPILITYDNSSRFLEFDHNTQEVIVHENTSLPVNTIIKKASITPLSTYKHTYENLLEMLQCPVESIFVYVCLFRKIFLSNSITWELSALKDYKVCGMIAMGELVYLNGSNQYHHGSSIFSTISETETYIVPDLEVLEDTTLIMQDIDALTNSDSTDYDEYEKVTYSNYNKVLKEKYSNFGNQEYYIDNDLKLPNMIKYRIDKKVCNYDKLCLVLVETADSIISFLGKNVYTEIAVKAIGIISKKYEKEFIEYGLSTYSFNYKTIFIVATEKTNMEEFEKICRMIHTDFEQMVNAHHDVTLIQKFTLIENRKHMLEKAIKYSFDNRDKFETFSIVPKDIEINKDEIADINIINMLKWAIDNDGIVPFYQGLYNNETKEIDKYESLMRIKDKNGKIHSPFVFLELSKRYHFYNKISTLMIEQVLEDFTDRTEKISLNISLRDIKHTEFRNWFLDKIEGFNDPSRITVELLESDDFKGDEIFFGFLNQVRTLGCKIAVDDFGSGYSTFMTILDIQPDYIKIDGSIIQKIGIDKKFKILLETLSVFSKKLDCKTVAEFVEDETIQNIVSENGITYSQGYFFSKPMPLENI